MKKQSLGSIIVLFSLYELFSRIVDKAIILPSCLEIMNEVIVIVSRADFGDIVFSTLSKTLTAFVSVLTISLVLGILAGYFKGLALFLFPMVTLLRTIPTVSIIIIILIWFGREVGPIFIVGLVVFPILYELISQSMNQVDADLRDVCYLFGGTPLEKFKALYYPQVLLSLYSGIQATLGLAFKVMVMAEVMAQSRLGIGQALNYEKTYLNMAGGLAWSILLMMIVLVFDAMVSYLMKKLLRGLE